MTHITNPDRPLRTFQAEAARREARPGRIRRALMIGAALLAIGPALQFADYAARKTAATVELAAKCRGMPECNPLDPGQRHD